MGSFTEQGDEHTAFSILTIPEAQQLSTGGYRGSPEVLQGVLLKGQQEEKSIPEAVLSKAR